MVQITMTAADILALVTCKEDVKLTEEGDGTTFGTEMPPDNPDPAPDTGEHGLTRYNSIDPVKALEELDLSHVPESHRGRLRDLLRDFSKIWDGSFGTIDAPSLG